MPGFKTHITTSSLLGVGYAGAGYYYGMPLESALIAGGLCGVGGMLPDIDSDSGIPFRESMGFAAAVVPMLLLPRFQQLGFNPEQLVLAGGGLYLFVRFVLAKMLAKYTVHRGMFHSIPAALVFAGSVFLLCGDVNLQLRYYKTGGVFIGVMSHLILDELNSIQWYRGRVKKSFGTALKLWSSSWVGNLSVYAKLVIVVLMILGEPMVMERYGHAPVAIHSSDWTRQLAGNNPNADYQRENPNGAAPHVGQQVVPQVDKTVYDTARRIWKSLGE